MKLVEFKDGKFGVRRWTIFGYEYLDFRDGFWWWLGSCWFNDCKTTQSAAEAAFAERTDRVKEVK